MTTTQTRNATLSDLAVLLQQQHARKLDMVVPSTSIVARYGRLEVKGADAVVEADGVTDPNGLYDPTEVADEHIAEKLSIPLAYVRRMRAERVDLWDANVNGWLHGSEWRLTQPGDPIIRSDQRSFMLRTFRPEDGSPGIARALLSDGYKMIDNLDVLTAALDGIRQTGVTVDVDGCDLTDKRMYMRITAPEVQALAPELLSGYRSPFTGDSGDENPTVFAGFVLSNSEVGFGAFSITPRLVVQVCKNGMTMKRDAMRAVHVGGKLDDGIIRWSDDTQQRNLELIAAKARDAVATFLDVDYMRSVIERLTEQASTPIADPAKAVEIVGKTLRFGEARTAAVLDHFIRGGQVTAGGMMHAVTSVAQTIDDADDAADFEAAGVAAMELVS